MATVWTIPIDVTSRWLDNAEVQTFLASNDLDNASPDALVRIAQFADVTKSLERHIGHTFSSVQGAATALFDGIDGGVPVALKLAALRLVLREVYQTRHAPQPFSRRVGEELGTYVYALVDPRNRSVFYTGTGRGNRVYGYVWEALAENEHRQTLGDPEPDSAEVRAATIARIRQIYDSGHEVEHYVVAHRISDSRNVADAVNHGLIGVLGLIDGSVLTNDVTGESAHRTIPVDDLVLQYEAEPVPNLPTPCVVLEVPAASRRGVTSEEVYELSRGPWAAGTAVRNTEDIPVIVFADNIVRAAYRANSWSSVARPGDVVLWRFTGESDPELETQFVNKRIASAQVGLNKWPSHGWVPHLTQARPGR
ncbi:GIY-YIG nuclease family protein [Rhodococcus marinonascens]|uniref:GIY-YIG nuclease family protein n=1 Tax=Rhodococcus marinonascens TaxID=38311 RepID=UPI000934BA8A|nr:GIY-YIG nuclease family protein [Rhodococcus marinonascens]